jgi:hypothetical protein
MQMPVIVFARCSRRGENHAGANNGGFNARSNTGVTLKRHGYFVFGGGNFALSTRLRRVLLFESSRSMVRALCNPDGFKLA